MAVSKKIAESPRTALPTINSLRQPVINWPSPEKNGESMQNYTGGVAIGNARYRGKILNDSSSTLISTYPFKKDYKHKRNNVWKFF